MADTEGRDLHVVPPVSDETGQPADEAVDDGPDEESRLSPRQVMFVDALAAGETSCHAAELAGVCARTGRRWRQRPAIQAALRSRLNDSLGAARAILAQGAARAARSLVDLSENATVGDASRVSASRSVLDGATKLVEVEELRSEMEAIKQQLAALPGNTNTRRFQS